MHSPHAIARSVLHWLCLQVAETLPAEVLAKMHAPEKPADVPIIDPHIIDQADGFVFGFPTRYFAVVSLHACCMRHCHAVIDFTSAQWVCSVPHRQAACLPHGTTASTVLNVVIVCGGHASRQACTEVSVSIAIVAVLQVWYDVCSDEGILRCHWPALVQGVTGEHIHSTKRKMHFHVTSFLFCLITS